MNVWYADGKFTVRGQRVDKLRGRSSFKFANLLSMHYSGQGDQYPGGALPTAERWVEHNQEIFGENVVLRVFGETQGWSEVAAEQGMFGSPARDQGIWNVEQLRNLCNQGARVKELTAKHKRVLEKAYQISHETGCVFEWSIVATLKHTDGLCTDVLDHVVRQVGAYARELAREYPDAAFIFEDTNEWDAHNQVRLSLDQLNRRAERWARWKNPVTGHTVISHTAPDGNYAPEQFPEAMFIVSHGGRDTFTYDVGPEPGKFKAGVIHPVRKGAGRDWRELPDMAQLRDDSRGQPVYFNESMYFISKVGTEHWYRNAAGWHRGLADMIQFYENLELAEGPDGYIVHDDIGAQTDSLWNPNSNWESVLAEFYGGNPTPPPPPTELTDSEAAVHRAYRAMLERNADPGGLAHWTEQLDNGLSYSALLLRLASSQESKNKLSKEP